MCLHFLKEHIMYTVQKSVHYILKEASIRRVILEMYANFEKIWIWNIFL